MQDQATFDLRYIFPEPSIGSRLYMLLLFVTCVAATIKLFKVWHVALPFRHSRKEDSPTYLRQLQASAMSIQQWMGFTFLAWGILASVHLTETCRFILNDRGRGHAQLILFDLIENATYLSMALLVVAFLYIIRWHMLRRGDRLRKWDAESNMRDSAR